MHYTIRSLLLFPRTVYMSHGTTLVVEEHSAPWTGQTFFTSKMGPIIKSSVPTAVVRLKKEGKVVQMFVLVYKGKLY